MRRFLILWALVMGALFVFSQIALIVLSINTYIVSTDSALAYRFASLTLASYVILLTMFVLHVLARNETDNKPRGAVFVDGKKIADIETWRVTLDD